MRQKRAVFRRFLLLSFLCASSSVVFALADDSVDQLIFASEHCHELRIFHFPNDVLTYVALTPNSLREQSTYRRTLSREKNPASFVALTNALRQTRVLTHVSYGDMRWVL